MDFNTLATIIAFLPGLAWMIFYLQEDQNPEPKYLIFITFISGFIAAIASFIVETFITKGLEAIKILPFNNESSSIHIIIFFALFALIEELIKFFVTYITIYKNKEFNEPVDAMIYMIVNALGFATLENIGILINNPTIKGIIPDLFQTISFRFIGATLLHTITSGILGYFWAISIREFEYKKPLIWGIILATLLHTLFNLFIIIYGNTTMTFLFLMSAGMFLLIDFEKLKYKKL